MSKDCRRLSSKTRRFFYDTPTNLSKISETNLISLKSSTSSHVRICSHVRIVFINLLPLNISLTYIIKEYSVGVHAREVIHFSRTLHAGIKDENSQACASWSIERAHILFKRHFSMTQTQLIHSDVSSSFYFAKFSWLQLFNIIFTEYASYCLCTFSNP